MLNANDDRQDYDVFISYRHQSGFYMAQLLFSKLTSNGYSVFMDKTMKSGEYEEKIKTAISNSRNFVLVLFPGDLDDCNSDNNWLNKEAAWAREVPGIYIIPLMCDGFNWPNDSLLSETMLAVKKNQGAVVHKDYSFDGDIDNLCQNFLKNVSPVNPQITSLDFFKYNLEERIDYDVQGVDIAFHAGAPWLMPGKKYDLFMRSLQRKIPWRVLINTPEAAESIGQHMRDPYALYVPFAQVRDHWKKIASIFPELIEVRECNIPLIHVHHAVRFTSKADQRPYGELHIKYYAYKNTLLDNAFEHLVNSYSKYYQIYNDEFMFLWEQSTKL